MKSHYFLYLGFGMIVSLWLLVGFWMYFPYNVIKINGPIKILTENVKSGGVLEYEVSYCKYTDAPALVTKQLIDNQVIFLPSVTSNLPQGCSTSKRSFDLPKIPSSTYRLHMTATYQINPLRTMTYKFDSAPFKINK